MSRQFQFSLGRLFVATGLVAAAAGTFVSATRCVPPWSIVVFVASCGVCGSAIGSLFHRPSTMIVAAIVGLIIGVCLAAYGISTSEL